MRSTLLLCGALLGAACTPARPPAPETRLAAAGDSLFLPYGDAGDAAHLGGRRWAVLLGGGPEVRLLDFAARTSARLGDAAALPGPITLFVGGDTLYVGDWLRRATTRWTLDGRPAGAMPADTAARGALPRARDAAGRFYLELRPLAGPDGSGNRDSARVLRSAGAAWDTVAGLAPLDLAKVASDNGERFERRVFSGVDRWGVRGDGTLWVARVYQNRVEILAPGAAPRRGPPLPDRLIEVTRQDREQFAERFPPALRATAQQLPFSPIKAAFVQGFADDAGRIWLERSRALADTTQSYLVTSPDGALERIVLLGGPEARVVAVAGRTALAYERVPGGIAFREVPIPDPPAAPEP